jgi:regulator of protease activity HflC (stomatin/prohibitin superfamily)
VVLGTRWQQLEAEGRAAAACLYSQARGCAHEQIALTKAERDAQISTAEARAKVKLEAQGDPKRVRAHARKGKGTVEADAIMARPSLSRRNPGRGHR